MSSWHSYPKVYALGHAAIKELLNDPVIVEEKIDGSQFSFGRFDSVLKIRSKNREMIPDAPEQMFAKAVETVQGLDLTDGVTYRAEYLQKPKHNTLAYDRVPTGNIILFDACIGEEEYLKYPQLVDEAQRLGLEVVPCLYEGVVDSVDMLKEFLELTSILGGQTIEGIVIKNYRRFGADKKVLMGKYVSEKFKEVHKTSWKLNNPGKKDIVLTLIDRYRTPARWEKAVQHLRDAGELENSPRDIGLLMKEVPNDLLDECGDEIKEALFKSFWRDIQRGAINGLPEWYKDRLAEQQFEAE